MEELQLRLPRADYRIEKYFAYLCGEDVTIPKPEYRTECYLAYLCGQDVAIPKPDRNIEYYLAYKCGMDVLLPYPQYRIEYFLAKWCGMDVWTPKPDYRLEYYLDSLANPAGELKTVTGNPISVSDALAKPAEALTIEILPQQDLHGYSNPWPAGGGKQLYNSATYETVTLGTITCTNNGDGSFTLNADEADTADRYFDIFKYQFDENVGGTPLPSAQYRLTGTPSGGSATTYTMYVRPSYSNDTGTGVTFTNSVIGGSILIKAGYRPQNLVFRPMLRLASVGDDTFATYSNICPISGFTGCNVTRTGVNVWDEEWEAGGLANATGATFPASDRIRSKNYSPCSASTSYYGKAPTQYLSIFWYDSSKAFISCESASNKVITSPSNAAFFKIVLANNVTTYNNDIAINYPSTDHDYHAYTGTTYSIDWTDEAGTVYGGELDVTNGVLTVTQASITKNTADMDNGEDWPGWKNSGVRSLVGTGINGAVPNAFSNISPVITSGDRAILVNTLNNLDILLLNKAYFNKTQSEWIALAMDVQIVVPLAEPQTIQLTPTEIEMLEGNNTLWADTGDITLTYMADGNADDVEALNILLGNRYVNLGEPDEATDREALEILLGGNTR